MGATIVDCSCRNCYPNDNDVVRNPCNYRSNRVACMRVSDPNSGLEKSSVWSVWLCCLTLCLGFGFIFPSSALGEETVRVRGSYQTALSEQERTEAEIILDAGQGQVRKWLRSPVLTIVPLVDFDETAFSGAVRRINLGLPDGLKIRLRHTGTMQIPADPDYIATFNMSPSDGPASVLTIWDGREIESDIFLFFGRAPETSRFSVITRTAEFAPRLARQYAKGEVECFFNVLSKNDIIETGYIFINSDSEYAEACVYEEIIQSLGLVNDAQNSRFFSLNNSASKPDTNHDIELLRALYDPSISAGVATGDVLMVLQKNLHNQHHDSEE